MTILDKCYLTAASDPPAASAMILTIDIPKESLNQLRITFDTTGVRVQMRSSDLLLHYYSYLKI